MDAIRQFIDVKNQSFQITLPDDFTARRVEVIILPSQNDTFELSEETKKMLDQRLDHYHKNPDDVDDFDKLLAELDNEI